MINKITRGDRIRGLVTYLFREGPDTRPSVEGRTAVEVHTDPHVIAAGRGIDIPIGEPLSRAQQSDLATQLDTPRVLFETEPKGGSVWQVSLSNGPDDRPLSDEEWADAARFAMERLGFDDGVKAACPWVAVRHGLSVGGNDHIHIAVSLVRENGQAASFWNDRVKMSGVCKELEARFRLVEVGGRHGESVTRWPDRSEFERAQADPDAPQPVPGQPRWTPTEEMAHVVRGVAAASVDEGEFVRRLYDAGYMVRPREATGDHTKVTGYSIKPIEAGDEAWRGGGRLAKDLSLPRLREQWAERGGEPVADQRAAWRSPARPLATTSPAAPEDLPREQRRIPADRWDTATATVRDTTTQLETGQISPADVAGPAAGAASALASRLEPDQAGPMHQLARQLATQPRRSRDTAPVDAGQARTVPLAIVAIVAMQAMRRRSMSAMLLAIELARLAQAIAEQHRLAGRLSEARRLERAATAVRVAADSSRQGSGPWQVDKDHLPAPPTPGTTPAKAMPPLDRQRSTAAHARAAELRRRQREQARNDPER